MKTYKCKVPVVDLLEKGVELKRGDKVYVYPVFESSEEYHILDVLENNIFKLSAIEIDSLTMDGEIDEDHPFNERFIEMVVAEKLFAYADCILAIDLNTNIHEQMGSS